jgi:hypothetical protein
VRIQEYVTDNKPFHGGDWVDDCKNQRQSHNFSGVGAHHQNYAERNIHSIFNMARAMLINFALNWQSIKLSIFGTIYQTLIPSSALLSYSHKLSFTIIIIFGIYMCLAVRSMSSILPYKMQRSCPSGIAEVDGQFILATVGNTPTMSIWFSTLKQATSLLSNILFSMIYFLLSIQMELSMPTSGTHW